jgi:hypothetical protein
MLDEATEKLKAPKHLSYYSSCGLSHRIDCPFNSKADDDSRMGWYLFGASTEVAKMAHESDGCEPPLAGRLGSPTQQRM